MYRSTTSLLLLGAALAALLAAAAAADCATGISLPGCKTCVKLTDAELAARKDAWNAKKAAWEAKKAASGQPLASPAVGKWDGKKTGPRWEAMQYKCTACVDTLAYQLQKDRCVCTPGFGIDFPAKQADGSRPPRASLECKPCADGTASGPDAPKPPRPDWSKKNGAPSGTTSTTGTTGTTTTPLGRHLLGKGGHHSICVKCPNGSNADHTKCL